MILETEFEASRPRELETYHDQHHMTLAGGDRGSLLWLDGQLQDCWAV